MPSFFFGELSLFSVNHCCASAYSLLGQSKKSLRHTVIMKTLVTINVEKIISHKTKA